jgi:hypothetical protein
MTQSDANEYSERCREPAWRYVGHVFAYRHPEGGTQFEVHPDTDFGEEKWIQMLKVPVLGTGLTYWEKIMCRLLDISYGEYLALKNNEGAVGGKESGHDVAQVSEARWSVPTLNQTAGLRSAQEVAATMKGEVFDGLPKHNCQKPGSPIVAFAPLDFSVVQALVERDATRQEVAAQVKIWIVAHAAKNPIPAEPEVQRLREAMLSNNPFAVYCAQTQRATTMRGLTLLCGYSTLGGLMNWLLMCQRSSLRASPPVLQKRTPSATSRGSRSDSRKPNCPNSQLPSTQVTPSPALGCRGPASQSTDQTRKRSKR